MAYNNYDNQHGECPLCLDKLTEAECDSLLYCDGLGSTNWITMRIQ